MRTRDVIEFLGLWEQFNNPGFNPLEFEGVRNAAGANAFTMSPKKWIEGTNAIGIISKSGRYGGTFAHKDIVFEFASWISAEFKLYIIKDYQRLKSDENSRLSLGWNLNRTLAKINYRIHTDAIKDMLIPPDVTPLRQGIRNAGVHLSVASNYRIVGYTVELKDSGNCRVLFSETLSPQNDPRNVGFTYESNELDTLLKTLDENASATLSVTVKSGPVGEDGEVPATTLTRTISSCNGHEGWTEVTDGSAGLDLVDGGTITAITSSNKAGAAVYIYGEGDGVAFNMYGGTISSSGTTASNSFGGVTVTGSANHVFNMYGGTIDGCSVPGSGSAGGGVAVLGGATFNMDDNGVIKNCSAAGNAGGVYVQDAGSTFNLYDPRGQKVRHRR